MNWKKTNQNYKFKQAVIAVLETHYANKVNKKTSRWGYTQISTVIDLKIIM